MHALKLRILQHLLKKEKVLDGYFKVNPRLETEQLQVVTKPTLVIWPWTSQAGCGHDYVYKPPTQGVMPRSVCLCQPVLLYMQNSTELFWVLHSEQMPVQLLMNRLPERGWLYMLSRVEAVMRIDQVNIYVTKTNSLDELYNWSYTWSNYWNIWPTLFYKQDIPLN